MKTNNKYNFYDTSSLLLRANNLLTDPDEIIVISSVTLGELEHIKNDNRKSNGIKAAAKKIIKLLRTNPSNVIIHVFLYGMITDDMRDAFDINNDMKILATAIDYDHFEHPDDVTFITSDSNLAEIANLYFGDDSIYYLDPENYQDQPYSGFKEVTLSEAEMAEFYQDLNCNKFDLLINQYIIIKSEAGEIVDRLCWTGETHRNLSYHTFTSSWFGDVRPFKDDTTQMFAADSLVHNKITLIHGPAGSGKSYIALGYLMHMLEKHKIDRIVVFCNTVAAKNSAKLGQKLGLLQ